MTDDRVEEHLLTLIGITSKLSEQLTNVRDSIDELETRLATKTAGFDTRFLVLEKRVSELEQKGLRRAKETWAVIRNYCIIAIVSTLIGTLPMIIKELLK